ncbi:alpha/beta fold hydrolase, partial [Salinispora arenicola]|uniref:alpha/beta fold hydrolase n=1 Tax=Salinispora arenicola TaxID=168697 RepID=UPI003CC7527D
MGKTISADGTPIGYDQRGDGPPVVLVTGALGDRDTLAPLANTLARHFTVFNYRSPRPAARAATSFRT